MKKNFGRIIWAADPLEDKKLRTHEIAMVRDLAVRTGATVEPVYLLSDGLLGLSVTESTMARQFKPASQRALEQLAQQAGLPKSDPPKVLVAVPSSRGGAADALDRYARKRKAELILVNSHGRQGLSRALFGSFAETLTLHAKTPILISGPRTKRVATLDHILFPTDFSAESRRAFEKVLGLAEKLEARVTVFYAAPNPVEPLLQSGVGLLGGGFITTPAYARPDYTRERKLAAQWVALAKKRGIRAAAAFDPDSTSVVQSILAYAAKSKPGVIAMASESGAVSAAILGSVGRGVARMAPCPVWFLR